jgi:hypothetical protein
LDPNPVVVRLANAVGCSAARKLRVNPYQPTFLETSEEVEAKKDEVAWMADASEVRQFLHFFFEFFLALKWKISSRERCRWLVQLMVLNR